MMEMLKLNIVDAARVRNNNNMVSVQARGRVTFAPDAQGKLGVGNGVYLLFATVGNVWYVTRKPDGYFGYKLRGAKKGRQLYCTSKSLQEIPIGFYNLGDPVLQNEVWWFPLIKGVD